MSVKANKTMIGAFVVGAVALVVAGVMILGGGQLFQQTSTFVFYFEGTVKGLTLGAPVVMKGVKIGTVNEITLQFDLDRGKFRTEVRAELYNETMPVGNPKTVERFLALREKSPKELRETFLENMVENGLRAQLGVQSFVTGMLQVELECHENVAEAKSGKTREGYWVIPTIPSNMELLESTLHNIPLEQIMNDLKKIVEGFENLVNSSTTTSSIASVNKTLAHLSELVEKLNSSYGTTNVKLIELIETTRQLFSATNEKLVSVAGELERFLANSRRLVENVDRRFEPISENLDGALTDARELMRSMDGHIEPLIADVHKLSGSAEAVMQEAQKSLALLSGLVPADSAVMFKLTTTLESFSQAMDNLKSLLAYLEQHPEALLRGKD